MSHPFGSGNSPRNSFLNKKRQEDDIPMENRYHYPKYSKYDKYTTHTRYNNLNYFHSRPPPGNNYYNNRCHNSNYFPSQKSYRRDYKKPYQKYPSPNTNENIRNLSYCEMTPSPPSSQKKSKDSSPKLTESNGSNSLNIRNINKFVSNIAQQNINIQFKLEEAKNEEEEELPIIKLPKLSEKINGLESFNRNLIDLEEENPLENFNLYPKNIFEKGKNYMQNVSKLSSNSKYINNFKNIIQLKSCYLLAKIPNWRLVTNFVPASELKQEKFENFILLDEKKNGDWGLVKEKPSLVFCEKYEEIVDKFLEQNKKKNKQVEMAIYNFQFIIAQYHNDILNIKNKINQNKFKINYLNIKQENSRNAIEQKFKE